MCPVLALSAAACYAKRMKVTSHRPRTTAAAQRAPAESAAPPAVPSTAAQQPEAAFAGTTSSGAVRPAAVQVPVGRTVENTPSGAARKLQRTGAGHVERTFAAIDLGSSSVKLLVQAQGADRRLRVVDDRRIGTNLGKGVGADGNLPDGNQQRVLDALRVLVAAAAEHGVAADEIPLIATAAVRNAPNGSAFIQRIRGEAGITRARVLTGDEEAQTGFQAALLGLEKRVPGRYATLDLGGGSFQLAVGTLEAMETGASTQVGSNRVQENLLPAGAISAADFSSADAQLAHLAPMPLAAEKLAGRRFVAMGGVSLFLKAQFGRNVIQRDEIEQLRASTGPLPPEERAAALLKNVGVEQRQALGVDTPEGARDYATKLPAKLTLLLHIMRTVGLDELHVSNADARHLLIHRDHAAET